MVHHQTYKILPGESNSHYQKYLEHMQLETYCTIFFLNGISHVSFYIPVFVAYKHKKISDHTKSSNFNTKRKKEMPIEVKDLGLSDNLIDEEE